VIGSDAPPSTFVPADDNIFGPSGYGAMWVIIGVVAILLALAVLAWCFHRLPVDRLAKVRREALPAMKARYVATIDELELEFAAHRLDERELHHRLSYTVREFAAGAGEPGALAMTASLLHEAGLSPVATVVAGYEQPQFKEWYESDPETSCHVAKAAIESW
jgi:hypothetical protein